jgi:hypothetical protein
VNIEYDTKKPPSPEDKKFDASLFGSSNQVFALYDLTLLIPREDGRVEKIGDLVMD